MSTQYFAFAVPMPDSLSNQISKPRPRRALCFTVAAITALLMAYGASRLLVRSGKWSPDDAAIIEARYANALTVVGALDTSKPGTAVKLTRAPYVQWITQTSAFVVWDTDKASTSSADFAVVNKGAAKNPGVLRVELDTRVTRHILRVTGLKAATTYRYRVASNRRVLTSGQFQTAKRAGQPFAFAVWGDSGMRSRGQFAVARAIEKARPDFLVHTGDLIYPAGAAADYNPKFFDVYKATLARAPFYGSLGNHDVRARNGQAFLGNFVLPPNGPAGIAPERNYSFDYADAHVAALDTNASTAQLRDVIIPWLRADMKRSRALWKFVFFHHPPYSSGEHGDEARIQRLLVPVLRELRVDIVFNGHDHGYERWKPRDGVVYVVSGAGGAGLYPRERNDPMTARFRNDVHSFTRIDIAGRKLRLRQIAHTGAVIDEWSKSK